ncbi:glycoside hydrolase family 13 protein [Paxillus rubicundulus Ve08.2h10]|uniref:Glycoside hydrolase family 13 protein n=1 Tax=Paxillus rubicundulus Ve08.2h10 TaxID=930991 RepID=A0A0D0E4T0_9AGAM|nr:glycoside hydrolase family 13 protein [Paxillus rubicundulus Ve08.2h10]
MSASHSREWWKSAVVYQIYPVSFFDSNGDGIGDLNGIREKLDYLKDLGVDVLWLSPIYRSPQADMGYDISDYRDIDPQYGTLEDWDNLLRGVHERGMKLMMDLVVNHTSDEHEWFLQSKSSKDDQKRDWYIWRPPKLVDGKRLPPNNWKSVFQGSAWDYDDKTGEYYLHLYVSKQPDLNWDNPVVRDAVWDVMRFWIDRGCDGFRMDVINIISKTEGLPDAPVVDDSQYYQAASMYFANGPRVHEYIKEMHTEVLSHHDLITVGETPFTHDASELAAYVLPQNKELNMVFHFELMDLDSPDYSPLVKKAWKLAELKDVVRRWQRYKRDEGFWNAVFIENHDHSRSVSRFGNDSDEWRAISAKMLSIFEVTQTGTLYVYQGQELGLKNFPPSWGIEEYKDVASQNYWNLIKAQRQKAQGKADVDMSDLLDNFQHKARDHARTPMQWDASFNGGFTKGTPWMRVNDDYHAWNAAVQLEDDDSVHAFWKRAIGVRKGCDVLMYGDFELLAPEHDQAFVYSRTLGNERALVLLNFSEVEAEVDLGGVGGVGGYRLVLGNYERKGGAGNHDGDGKLVLRGYEGRVYVQ